MEKDTRIPAQCIQEEMNNQVRKWGIDIQRVELSTAKILKQAGNNSGSTMVSILKGKGEQEFPTPKEFIQASQGLSEENSSSMAASRPVGNPGTYHVP